MTEFLWPVMYAVHYATNNPEDAAKVHAELKQRPQANLVSGWYFEDGRIKVNVSTKKLDREYGEPALRIWRKLFVQDKQGGYSRSTGKAFDSSWYLNRDADRRYFFGVTRYLSKGGITPAQALDLLADIEERVNAIVEYKVRISPLGYRGLVAAKRREMTTADRKVHIAAAKPLRAELAMLNTANKARLIEAEEQRYQRVLTGMKAMLQRRREEAALLLPS